MVSGPGVCEPDGSRWFSNAVLVGSDPKAFASVLCRLHADRRRLSLMGREAAAFSAERYDIDLLARNYERLYARLLGERGAPPGNSAVASRANDMAN